MSDLITLAYAKASGRFDDLEDDIISYNISVCSALIQDRLKRDLIQSDRTEIHDGDNTKTLFLRDFPINTLDNITITDSQGTEYSFGTGSGGAETYFRINKTTGEVQWDPTNTDQPGVFIEGFQSVSVSFNAGVLIGNMYWWAREACLRAMSNLENTKEADSNVASFRLGDYSETKTAISAYADRIITSDINTLLFTHGNHIY